jgi:hypothetical protein
MSTKARKRYARQERKQYSNEAWDRLTMVMAPGYRQFLEMIARYFDLNISELG